jgi:hypothetical protein
VYISQPALHVLDSSTRRRVHHAVLSDTKCSTSIFSFMPGPLFQCSVDFRSLLQVQHVTLPKTYVFPNLVSFVRLGEPLLNDARALIWTRFGDVKPGLVVIFSFPHLLVNLLPPSEQSFPRTPVSITCLVMRSD